MDSVILRDPHFVAATSSAFHRDQIADLAAGRSVAVRVPDFMPRARTDEVLRALTSAEFESYGTKRVYPPVMRFGVGVSDHRQDGAVADSYWDALAGSRRAWSDLGLSFDPFAECRSRLARHWPKKAAVGRRGGRELGEGVAREPNQGFQVHFDDVAREFSDGLLDANLIAQFAFNLYLSVPNEGGETVIWRHRWKPADESFRLPHSYGYSPEVVGDAEFMELKPQVGEALLIDPRNFHAVRPSRDARRIALGFAVGMTDEGELLVWA